jgi:hypothetical protein
MLRRAKLCVLAIYPAPTIPNLSSLSIVRLNALEGDQNGSFVNGGQLDQQQAEHLAALCKAMQSPPA